MEFYKSTAGAKRLKYEINVLGSMHNAVHDHSKSANGFTCIGDLSNWIDPIKDEVRHTAQQDKKLAKMRYVNQIKKLDDFYLELHPSSWVWSTSIRAEGLGYMAYLAERYMGMYKQPVNIVRLVERAVKKEKVYPYWGINRYVQIRRKVLSFCLRDLGLTSDSDKIFVRDKDGIPKLFAIYGPKYDGIEDRYPNKYKRYKHYDEEEL